jgi:hypothetical protein
MTTNSPPDLGQSLRRALRKVAAPEEPEGQYIPGDNRRELSLGIDHTTMTSRMVVWHEALHAVLNGSTTFGNLMITASALEAAGDADFDRLVATMISVAWTTHETYATVASLYSATQGHFDSSLLHNYPIYLRLFEDFDRAFDLGNTPHVGSLCIDTAARVAMQTSTIQKFLDRDCAEWPDLIFEERERPDARFAVFLNKKDATVLRAAIVNAMENGPEPFRRIAHGRLDGAGALDLVRQTSPAEQDALSKIAFEVAASILFEKGFETLGFDDQRLLAARIINKVEAYAGERLKTKFYVPGDLVDDRDAIIADFRHEMLTVYRAGQAAGFLACKADDQFLLDSFQHEGQVSQYFEVCVMPKAKAVALYSPIFDIEVLEPQANLIFALRRRIAANEVWPNGLIEFAVMKSSDELADIRRRYPQNKIYVVASAHVFHETSFFRRWETEGFSDLLDGYLVVIDMDPFHLLGLLSKSGRVAVNRGNVRVNEGAELRTMEFVCFSRETEPNTVHFTPCSGPFLDAITTYCQTAGLNTIAGGGLTSEQNELLKTVAGHVVREEPKFGYDFWD